MSGRCYQQLHINISRSVLLTIEGMGRPPAAKDQSGNPSKTSTWPKITFPALPATRKTLSALAMLEGRTQREIIEDALRDYVAKLPAEDRRMVEAMARRAGTKTKSP